MIAHALRLRLGPKCSNHRIIQIQGNARLAKTYEVTLKMADKQTQYFQFELPPFILGNAFYLGSSITPRTAEQAQTEMKALKEVK